VLRLAADWPPALREVGFDGSDEYTHVVRSRAALISAALRRLVAAYPAMRDYDQRRMDATAEDMAHVVDFLTAALYVGEPQIFTDFVAWAAGVLQARQVPPVALTFGLSAVRDQLSDYPAALAMLDEGAALLPGINGSRDREASG
jgi:hypothetical protein